MTKLNGVYFEEMTIDAYCKSRGWSMPSDIECGSKGYKVMNKNECSVWMSKEEFEEQYAEYFTMSFGIALKLMKDGCKVARAEWNGKGMFVVYQKGYPQGIPCNKQTAEVWDMKEGDLFVCNPYLQIKCTDGTHSMWVPSINDILADDWCIVD